MHLVLMFGLCLSFGFRSTSPGGRRLEGLVLRGAFGQGRNGK
jgi:hypothetical protein